MTGHSGIGDGGRLTARIALNRGTLQAVDAAIDKVRESQSLRRFGQDWATAPLVVARFLALAPGPLRGQWTVTRMPFGPLARAWMLVALWALAVTMRCLSPVATWRSRMLQRRVVGGVDGGGWCGENVSEHLDRSVAWPSSGDLLLHYLYRCMRSVEGDLLTGPRTLWGIGPGRLRFGCGGDRLQRSQVPVQGRAPRLGECYLPPGA